MQNKGRAKIKKYAVKLAVLLLWLGVWQGVYMLVSKDILLVSPLMVFKRLCELVVQAMFWKSVLYTFLRIVFGFVLGVFFGTLLAILTVSSSFLKELFKPVISLVKATPVASFIILALVWIKKDSVPVFITFLMVLPIIWANVSEGIISTDKRLLEMAKVFEFGKLKKLRLIYFNSVLPFFAASSTTALGLAWKAGVAAEVIAMSNNSIGYNLYRSKINIETADLFAWTAVVILLSVVLEKAIRALLKKYDRRTKKC